MAQVGRQNNASKLTILTTLEERPLLGLEPLATCELENVHVNGEGEDHRNIAGHALDIQLLLDVSGGSAQRVPHHTGAAQGRFVGESSLHSEDVYGR